MIFILLSGNKDNTLMPYELFGVVVEKIIV